MANSPSEFVWRLSVMVLAAIAAHTALDIKTGSTIRDRDYTIPRFLAIVAMSAGMIASVIR